MGFRGTLRAVCGAALAGALVFASAPIAAADQTREDQWPLKEFDAAAIWKISTGKGVVVAVIDGGVNRQHVDLKGSVIEGKDFVDGGPTTPSPGDYHGTGMASDIAGHGHGENSSSGVMGLAPESKILDIRDLGTRSDGLAGSIRYAVDHGAAVINISEGGGRSQDKNAEPEAIAYALKHDVLVVAATGNDAEEAGYPASYPGVLAVGGVQNDGEIYSKSNYGPTLLTAPATSIVDAGGSTDTSYRVGSGTSDATAFVSAAAALLRSKFPDLTAGQIANRLTKTAGLPASAKGIKLPDNHYGYGFIQPLTALTADIPAGPKYGPLTVPQSLADAKSASLSPSAKASATQSGAAHNDQAAGDNKSAILLAALGLGGLVVIGIVVLLIVKSSRRKGGGGGPGAPSGFGAGAGYPSYGQQSNPYQPARGNPYGQPQSPNPYQQQQPQAPGHRPGQP